MPLETPARWVAYCDGSAAPNPGRMAYGVVIVAPDGTRKTLAASAGAAVGCNNEAELMALRAALGALRRLGARQVLLHSDNSVVVDALRAAAASPSNALPMARLAAAFEEVRAVMQSFDTVQLQWIPRHRNAEADALARQAAGLPPKEVMPPGRRRKPGANRKRPEER